MSIPQEKPCSKCGISKPLDQFIVDNRLASGRGARCKVCKAATRNRYTPEEFFARHNNAKANKRKRALERKWANIEQVRAQDRLSAAKWRAKNPDHNRITSAAYRKQNPSYMRLYLKGYKRRNKAKVKAWEHKRRAALRAGGSFTDLEWINLCEKYGEKCLRCQQIVALTPDHVVPLALGGTNTIDNIQPLCGSCNSWKGARHIDYRN